jgi:predicted MFS family arabinose efflux permease
MKHARNLLTGSIIILILAQGLNFLLGVSSFESTYRTSLISRYRIEAGDLRNTVETSVNYGKPITLFSGMEPLLADMLGRDGTLRNVHVTDRDGTVLHSTEARLVQTAVPVPDPPSFQDEPGEDERAAYAVSENDGSYFVALPIYFNKRYWVGSVYVEFGRSIISERVAGMLRQNLGFFFPVLAGGVAVLVALLLLLNREAAERGAEKRRRNANYAVLIATLITTQLAYAYNSNRYYERTYLDLFNTNMGTLSRVVQSEFDQVLSYGLPVERLKKAEVLLERRVRDNRECLNITVTDAVGRPLYYADRETALSVLEPGHAQGLQALPATVDEALRQTVPLGGAERPSGYARLRINDGLIRSISRDLLLDAVTVAVVALVFGFELLGFLSLLMNRRRRDGGQLEPEVAEENRIRVIRVIAFTLFFAEWIPLSFLPLFIQDLQAVKPIAIAGLPAESMLAVPISVYMLGVTISVLVFGFLSKRIRLRDTFFAGGAFLVAGAFTSAFAPDVLVLSAARLVSGIGYGACLVSATSLVVEYTSTGRRSTGFGNWSAGYAAASICALAIGGVIVSRLGFRAGMLVSGSFAILFVLVAAVMVKSRPRERSQGAPEEQPQERFRASDLFYLFRNRRLLANLLFCGIPIQLATIGVFQFVFPLYMNNVGIGQANIGRLLTIYGIIALFTPFVSRLADRVRNDRLFIAAGSLIAGAFLLLFLVSDSIVMFAVVLVAMGVGAMVVDAVEESFLTSAPDVKRIGEARALSIYGTYEKVASVAVPAIMGLLITFLGYSRSVIASGAILLVGTLAFLALSGSARKGSATGQRADGGA